MKKNMDVDISQEIQPVDETAPVDAHRHAGSIRLKLLVAAVAVTAAWLSYQVANEALALRGLLDQAQEAASARLPIKTSDSSGPNITETKARVAGL